MPERPRPDMDRTRDALRAHDERAGDHADDEPAPAPPEREAGEDEEDEEGAG